MDTRRAKTPPTEVVNGKLAMFEGIFNNTTVPVLQEVVAFNEARHGVLAGNIANIDTPGYKTRDLDEKAFRSQLREAIADRNRPPSPLSADYPNVSHNRPLAEQVRDPETILRHDEDNVGVEQQVAKMVKNQMEYNICLNIMTHQMQQLKTAISERL